MNLTRFNPFFPEKREFFLENQGSFQIGRTYDVNDLVPFFSRSIGLEGGTPVDIEGGARLSGRVGRNDLGLLNIQSEDGNSSVLRHGRQFSGSSTANVCYLGKEGRRSNRVTGGDLRLTPHRYLSLDLLAMRSEDSSAGGGGAWRAGAIFDSSRIQLQGSFTALGSAFRDELGFIPRLGVDIVHGVVMPRFRPVSMARLVREWRPQIAYDRYERPGFGVETEAVKPGFTVELQDGSTVTAVWRAWRGSRSSTTCCSCGSTRRFPPACSSTRSCSTTG